MFESCVLQSDISISLDFDADTKQRHKQACWARRLLLNCRSEKILHRCSRKKVSDSFFRSFSSKIKWHLPNNPHMWKKWPNDLQLFRPTCLMPPTTVLSDTPPTGKSILHVCLLSLLPWKDWPHTSCHTRTVWTGGAAASFGVVSSKISFCLPPLHLSHTQRSVWTPSN